jgi:hypothetical protein
MSFTLSYGHGKCRLEGRSCMPRSINRHSTLKPEQEVTLHRDPEELSYRDTRYQSLGKLGRSLTVTEILFYWMYKRHKRLNLLSRMVTTFSVQASARFAHCHWTLCATSGCVQRSANCGSSFLSCIIPRHYNVHESFKAFFTPHPIYLKSSI